MSQIHLKNNVFFVTPLRRFKYISRKIFFHVTSLRRLKDISKKKRCFICDVSDTSQKCLLKVFVTIQKYTTKMVSC